MAVNVYWNHWSWWTLCSNPCSSGTRTRTRQCIPHHGNWYGGINGCPDSKDETQDCSTSVQPGILHRSYIKLTVVFKLMNIPSKVQAFH